MYFKLSIVIMPTISIKWTEPHTIELYHADLKLTRHYLQIPPYQHSMLQLAFLYILIGQHL